MSKIDPSLYLANRPSTATPSNNLGKDEFLKILMVQLQNQDPLEPMKDQDFIAQMATFSSLEQLMHMNQMMEQLAYSQSQSSLLDFSHLIGKAVEYNVYDDDGLIEGVEKGVVQSVSFKNNAISIVLEDGTKVDINSIVEISQSVEGSNEEEQKEGV